MNALEQTLSGLGFESGEVRVYEFLLRHGPTAVGLLAKRIGAPRSTLYTMLTRLVARGLVRESVKKGLKTYSAEPPDTITHLFSLQREQLESSEKSFSALLPTLRGEYQSLPSAPRMSVFEGAQGLHNVLNDMLHYADLETCAVWPIRKMMETLSPEFFQFHNKERIKRNIYTRAVWPRAEAIEIADYPFLGWGEEFLREIRIAPEQTTYSLGYWIYANKVAFLSSSAEGYGFILQSEELVATLKAQFELLWDLSTALSFDKKSVMEFLASLRAAKV